MQDLEYLALYAAEHRLQEQHRRVGGIERRYERRYERRHEPRVGFARSSRLFGQRIRASRRHDR
jgi:hypothetical protein